MAVAPFQHDIPVEETVRGSYGDHLHLNSDGGEGMRQGHPSIEAWNSSKPQVEAIVILLPLYAKRRANFSCSRWCFSPPPMLLTPPMAFTA